MAALSTFLQVSACTVNGLENRRPCKGSGVSNPSPPAIQFDAQGGPTAPSGGSSSYTGLRKQQSDHGSIHMLEKCLAEQDVERVSRFGNRQVVGAG
jgi:hypothetical protein